MLWQPGETYPDAGSMVFVHCNHQNHAKPSSCKSVPDSGTLLWQQEVNQDSRQIRNICLNGYWVSQFWVQMEFASPYQSNWSLRLMINLPHGYCRSSDIAHKVLYTIKVLKSVAVIVTIPRLGIIFFQELAMTFLRGGKSKWKWSNIN